MLLFAAAAGAGRLRSDRTASHPARMGECAVPKVLDQRYEPAVELDRVAEHPRNPRRGDQAAIAESIAANDFYGALVVQTSSGRIIVGNHRYREARAAGIAALPVLYVDVDDERAERIAIADNRTGELAGWDQALLLEILEAQPSLEGTGFTAAAVAELEAAVRGVPPDDFKGVDDDLPIDYRCPSCCYGWSGKPIGDCEPAS